jgi:hypothetical protein
LLLTCFWMMPPSQQPVPHTCGLVSHHTHIL